MTTLIFTAAGAAIGGPIGSLIGAAIGSQVDRRLLGGGSRSARHEGPRLADLSVQSAAYGAPVPLSYGKARLAGNVIWSTGLIEQRQEETTSSGGKGGGGGSRVTSVSYTYSASFAVALTGRQITRIDRIWADGKLIRQAGDNLNVGGQLRVYLGDENQLPDPLIEAHQGVGQVPAHRGLSLAVFEGLPLGEFANRIPNLTFEVIAEDGDVGYGIILSDLMSRAAPALNINVTGLSGIVEGYTIAEPGAVRDAIEPLAALIPVQSVERGNALIFADLEQAAIANLSVADVGAGREGEAHRAFTVERRQDWELPREIAVHYFDRDRDYQPNLQRARRQSGGNVHMRSLQLPVATNANIAKRAAEAQLARNWTARDQLSLTLGFTHLALEPGDVVTYQDNGIEHQLIITEQEIADGWVKITGPRYNPLDNSSDAVGDGGLPIGQNPAVQGPTTLHLLALPTLPGGDLNLPRYHVAGAGDNAAWRSAVVMESIDGGVTYTEAARLLSPAVMGSLLTSLAPGNPHGWNGAVSVDVALLSTDMTLESRPELAILNGANAALIGDEIIQFTTATLIAAGQYRLSGLLRGRLGTRMAQANAGVRFILLKGAGLMPVSTSLGAIGQPRLYKALGPTENLSEAAAQSFTYGGENLKPLSPVHARASRNSSGDLSLSWIRRSRAGFDWIDFADVPLGEEQEVYEVEVLNAGTPVRVLSVTTPSALYSAAEQIVDFGAAQSSIALRIYQMSAAVGRGHALEINA